MDSDAIADVDVEVLEIGTAGAGGTVDDVDVTVLNGTGVSAIELVESWIVFVVENVTTEASEVVVIAETGNNDITADADVVELDSTGAGSIVDEDGVVVSVIDGINVVLEINDTEDDTIGSASDEAIDEKVEITEETLDKIEFDVDGANGEDVDSDSTGVIIESVDEVTDALTEFASVGLKLDISVVESTDEIT